MVAFALGTGLATAALATDTPPAWQAFSQAWAQSGAFSARITAYERRGTRAETIVVDYNYQSPAHATVRVVQGPNRGAILVWDGGATLQAHLGGGLLYGLSKSIPLHDPSVESPRGSSLDELSYASILRHGDTTPGTSSEQAGETIGGVSTDAVSLTPADPAADGGLTREVVEIATTTHLPLRIRGYEGTTLVRQIDFANVALKR
ncbi:MAG TPA: hypothetical protein VMD91_19280 [Candidatus Sulfotelmatobacter sp.]|nr:hypothetical protein [Candidatus Sulfotelmatobacter sp.]